MKNVRENIMIFCMYPRSVKEIIKTLNVSPGTISYHLKKLTEEGIFSKNKENNKVGQPTKYFCKFIVDDDWDFCYFCGGDQKAEKHHIIPKSKGGDDTRENFLKLCKTCHKNIHSEKWFLHLSEGHYLMRDQLTKKIIKYPSMRQIYNLRNPPINSIKIALKRGKFKSGICK